jgi:uncharacterized protein involved in outer membrane biogenesis
MARPSLLLKTIVPLFLVLFMAFYLVWHKVPSYLSNQLSNAFLTQVYIGDATLSPYTIALKKIAIGSPKNSRLPKSFACEKLSINTWLYEYLKDQVVIDEIVLDNVYLGLEFDTAQSTNGNWTILMQNLKNSKSAHQSKGNKSFFIKKLTVKNIQCQVLYNDRRNGLFDLSPIDELTFTDISTDKGFPIEQLMDSVLGQTLKEIFIRENLKDMLNKIIEQQDQIQQFVKPFKLF